MKMPTTLKDYEVLENIGEGSYGVCRKVRRKKDGKILVWKELDYGCMTETEKQLLVSEVNLLRELRHKYIVCYHDRIIDRTSSKLYIIMEYCEGGDVSSLIKKLKKEGKRIEESAVWKICTQVLLALQECHSRSKNGKVVLHRDLKPANVFLDSDMNVKLGDFGLARVLSHETSFARTYVGTPYYMSPEQMNRMSYNEKSDVWSLGCLLYELTALKPPFTASGIHELTSKINQGRFARIPFRYSDDLNNLISNILQVDECGRPGVEELLREPLIRHQVALLQPAAASSSHSAPPRARPASLHGSDEGYESLKRREEAIIQQEEAIIQQEKALAKKERLLQEKQKDLEQRELALDTREQNVREEIMKMERLSLALRSGEGGEMLCVRPSPRASDCGTVSTPAAAGKVAAARTAAGCRHSGGGRRFTTSRDVCFLASPGQPNRSPLTPHHNRTLSSDSFLPFIVKPLAKNAALDEHNKENFPMKMHLQKYSRDHPSQSTAAKTDNLLSRDRNVKNVSKGKPCPGLR